MIPARALVAATLLMLATGCTSWPDAGTGGLAERLPLPATLDPDATRRLRCVEAQLAEQEPWLRVNAPGELVRLRALAVRARRELVGGLPADAVRNMDRLSDRLSPRPQSASTAPIAGAATPPCKA